SDGSNATTFGAGRNMQPAAHAAAPQNAARRPFSSNPCPQVQQYYSLTNTPQTITLPPYCGSTGSSKIPAVLNVTSSNTKTLSVCESSAPVGSSSSSSGNCSGQQTQFPGTQTCSEAANTLLYSTLLIIRAPP